MRITPKNILNYLEKEVNVEVQIIDQNDEYQDLPLTIVFKDVKLLDFDHKNLKIRFKRQSGQILTLNPLKVYCNSH